jgi:hypothetical protein
MHWPADAMAQVPLRLAGAGSHTPTLAVLLALPPAPVAVSVNEVVALTWGETLPPEGGVTGPTPGAMLTESAPDTDQVSSTTPPSPISNGGVATNDWTIGGT